VESMPSIFDCQPAKFLKGCLVVRSHTTQSFSVRRGGNVSRDEFAKVGFKGTRAPFARRKIKAATLAAQIPTAWQCLAELALLLFFGRLRSRHGWRSWGGLRRRCSGRL
jgi:hypothetical protein